MGILGVVFILAAIVLVMLMVRRDRSRGDDHAGDSVVFDDGAGDGGDYGHHDSGGFDGGHGGFDAGHGGDAAGGGDSGAGGDGGGHKGVAVGTLSAFVERRRRRPSPRRAGSGRSP